MTHSRVNLQQEYNGYAAEDIEPNSVVLKVTCPELLPGSGYGTVAAGITEGVSKLTDRDGNPLSTTFISANHIVATWEGASNSRYPPRIKKGEPVKLFRQADQDKFEWSAKGKGRDYRTTDRVVMEVSAVRQEDINKPRDDTNTYSVTLDSDAQKVSMRTSKANGEAAAFSMEADLKLGTFVITDDSEEPSNRIFLDTGAMSGKPVIHFNLNTGTTIKLEDDDIFVKLAGKFVVDAQDRIIFNSPLTIFNLNQKGHMFINVLSLKINSARDIVLSAASVIGLNAVGVKVTGILKTATAVIGNAIKGAVSDSYKGSSIKRPEDSPVTDGNDSPDTNTVGTPYRSP